MNGDLREKWEKLEGWAEGNNKGVKVIIGGDFNVRTGTRGDGGRKRKVSRGRERESRWMVWQTRRVDG